MPAGSNSGDPGKRPAPPRRRPSIAIVGAGVGGIGMAIRLRQEGFEDFTLYEKAADLGGTWRENTYPGAACDVPSHLYSYSFEPNPDWSRRYAPQREILEYVRGCAERHGITERIRFGTEIVAASFDEAQGRWTLDLSGGQTAEADVLVCATGQLSRPAFAPVRGLDDFRGPQFHSAGWDHEVDLAGRRVAVIGTGASAIQFVPEIAERAAKVTVFQRTPPWVIHKPDRRYPRWVKAALRRVPGLLRLARARIYWTFELFNLGLIRYRWPRPIFRRWATRQLRRGGVWSDRELREALTPDYEIGCKRVLQSNDWYPTLDRPNVELVAGGVTEVRPEGVLADDGELHEADVLIHGTGFQTNDFLAPMEVRGRGGTELGEAWRDGARAYLGITVPRFPSMFILYGPNTNLGGNSIIFMLEAQYEHVLGCLRRIEAERAGWIEVSEEAFERADEEIQAALEDTVWESGCNSWYRVEGGRNTNNWPLTTVEYRRRCEDVNGQTYRLGVSEQAGVRATT